MWSIGVATNAGIVHSDPGSQFFFTQLSGQHSCNE